MMQNSKIVFPQMSILNASVSRNFVENTKLFGLLIFWHCKNHEYQRSINSYRKWIN